jgi:transient receptor potential cation channel subfamily M protein 2
VSENTKTAPTDAFGEIEFGGFGQRRSKVIDHTYPRAYANDGKILSFEQFVRVDQKTAPETLLQLMKEFWELKAPNLLISVTGGAKNFTMRPRLKEVFNRGLMKAAESTGQ